jgi:hypothetical protein
VNPCEPPGREPRRGKAAVEMALMLLLSRTRRVSKPILSLPVGCPGGALLLSHSLPTLEAQSIPQRSIHV